MSNMDKELKNTNPSGVSFGFTKTISKKALESSVINETDEKVSDTARAERTQTWSGKQRNEEEKLVIPLKSGTWQLGRWKEDVRKENSESKNRIIETVDEATNAAVKEILAEAKQSEEEDENLTITIVSQNLDRTERGVGLVRHRPRLSDNDREIEDKDYETVPIEQFGKAWMRGLGWKDEEESSGKAYEVRPRPQGLGLGADVPLHSAAYAAKGKTGNKEDDEEERLMLEAGVHCQVLTGKLEGQYGMVTGIEEDAVRVYVTMSLSGENVTLSQYAIKLVTKAEYDKEHRYINKKCVEKYKSEKSDFKTDGEKSQKTNDRSHKDDDRSHKDDDRSHKDDDRSRRKREANDDDVDKTSSKRKSNSERRTDEKVAKKTNERSSSSSLWVHPCLRVRFVDEKYKNGKYFKTKLVIIDVVSRDSCICRTENGQLLEGITQDQLETVIPRDLTSSVMIVRGSHRAQLAEIVERDKERCRAVVQFIPDRDEVITLDYDSICEYVGHVD